MAPNFIRSLRERGLPPDPPAENPHDAARAQWETLREYAVKVAEIARETDETSKTLQAENDSLRREVERLTASNTKLARENRTVNAYAQSIRTRLTVIRETIESAERESLEHARDAREPEAEAPRINAGTADRIRMQVNGVTMPPANAWPATADEPYRRDTI